MNKLHFSTQCVMCTHAYWHEKVPLDGWCVICVSKLIAQNCLWSQNGSRVLHIYVNTKLSLCMGKVKIPHRIKPFLLVRGCRGKHVAWQGGDISDLTRKVRKMSLYWCDGQICMHVCLSSILKWVFFLFLPLPKKERRKKKKWSWGIIVVVVKLHYSNNLRIFLCC